MCCAVWENLYCRFRDRAVITMKYTLVYTFSQSQIPAMLQKH